MMQTILDSLRREGWSVMGHYDQVEGKVFSTYWKLRKGNQIVAGEGPSDAEALSSIRARIGMDPREPLNDAGPWSAARESESVAAGEKARTYMQSCDFTHDVRLYVDGDFATADDCLAYAQALAARMNAMPVPESAPAKPEARTS